MPKSIVEKTCTCSCHNGQTGGGCGDCNSNHYATKSIIEKVIEEFDDGVGRRIMSLEESYCTEMGFDCDFADYHETKSFLRTSLLTALEEQRESIVEKIEKYADQNDDGLWSGREITDNIIGIINNHKDHEKEK